MNITGSAISLNVADVNASAAWAQNHLGFRVEMEADGFCSLSHAEAGFNLIYLRTGLSTFKPESAAGSADGLLVVFTVSDIDADYARVVQQGVDVVTPIETEPWGGALFPNGRPERSSFELHTAWIGPVR